MKTRHVKEFLDTAYKSVMLLSGLAVSVGALTALTKVFMPQIKLTALLALVAAGSYYYSDKVDSEQLFRDVDRFIGVEPVQNRVGGGLGGRQRRIYTYS
ncbi:hypothetical protein SAMN05443574_1249 [Haloarcula vallismortis]|uniref:Uncharacterized protein n=2 Tax=Haloarcula vallismortis TaxID=28442 RepID=M0JQN5_HALVA|nr:hypothetical protein [Haloarcula vallismortis]EMA09960.1 hypothetical protein C437_04865 [Haloarcula vallismortis ATCC 29715]SDX27717.1 hypothetical protein SAMN05443574_1249 [Haloarcula vallismortis]